MKLILDKTQRFKPKVIVEYVDSNGEVHTFTCDISLYGTSVANKFQKLVKDIEEITELTNYDEVIAELIRFHRKLHGEIFIEKISQVFKQYREKSERFQYWHNVILEDFEIERDVSDQILEFIYVNKMLFPFTHLSCFSSSKDKVFNALIKKYKTILDRLYEIVYTKIKYNMSDKIYLGYMRNALDIDYIVHYNYDFSIFTSSLLYELDTKKHPLSYLVSVAADNANFLIATYSETKKERFDDNKVVDIQNNKGHLLLELTDELIVNRLIDLSMLLVNKYKVEFDFKHVHDSTIYSHIIVPIYSKALGVNHHKLITLEKHHKFLISWLLYYIFVKDEKLRQAINRKAGLFLIGTHDKRGKPFGITKAHIQLLTNDLQVNQIYISDLIVDILRTLPKSGIYPLIIKHKTIEINDETLKPLFKLMYKVLVQNKHVDDIRKALDKLAQFNKIGIDFKKVVHKF